jgi:hypothetical protein
MDSVSTSSHHSISSSRDVCSRWLPRQLTEAYKTTRTEWSLMLLRRYEEHDEAFLSRTVTGDDLELSLYPTEQG